MTNAERQHKYYYKNQGRLQEVARENRRVNAERYNKNRRLRARSLRLEVLIAYGHRCECCGENRFEFLAVDHTYGGGKKDRESFRGSGLSFYQWLKNNEFPKDNYRILCHNCNLSRGFYGYCPHEKLEKEK